MTQGARRSGSGLSFHHECHKVVHSITLKSMRNMFCKSVKIIYCMAVKLPLTLVCYVNVLNVQSSLTHVYTFLCSSAATSRFPSVISTHVR